MPPPFPRPIIPFPPTTPPEPPAGVEPAEGQGGVNQLQAEDSAEGKASAPRVRRKRTAGPAAGSKMEGRRLYLSESVHFRLRMLAYQRGQKLSEVAEDVLDKALPKWNVERTG